MCMRRARALVRVFLQFVKMSRTLDIVVRLQTNMEPLSPHHIRPGTSCASTMSEVGGGGLPHQHKHDVKRRRARKKESNFSYIYVATLLHIIIA